MKRILMLLLVLGLTPVLWAQERRQLNVGFVQNLQGYPFGDIDSSLNSVSNAYGIKGEYLQEYKPDIWWGASYERLLASGTDTLANAEYVDGLIEYFWGNRQKMAEKGPFWDKLYVRAGGRVGLYRWWIHGKNNYQMTEKRDGPFYYSFGLNLAPHVAIGLGQLGSLEYVYRMHFSGAADVAQINNTYLTYVYSMAF